MLAVAAITALAAASLAIAQNSSITIQVGAEETTAGGIFQFIPANVTASNGTTITFVWQGSPGNHTVIQSTADNPCQPLQDGFNSGFLLVPANITTDFPTWNLTVTNDQAPIYFYCAQLVPTPHCSTAGMVGSINAPASGPGSWDAVVAAALLTNATIPGQPASNNTLGGVNATVTAAPGPVGTSTAGVQGFDLPVASGAASSTGGSTSASSSASGSGSGSPSPAPTSGGVVNVVSGVALVLSALVGTLLA